MSAFLGPIHFWLYNKIKIQQAIVDDIHNISSKYGLSLKEDCDNRYGEFENRPLDEIIDPCNIHGWLQEKVSQVEYKYAYSVKTLLDKDPAVLTELEYLHTEKGRELGQTIKESSPSASDLFKAISDNLLDGMPCDHANTVLENDKTCVVWKRNLCVHAQYWEAVGADISIYYRLRKAWITGLAMECGFAFSQIDPVTCCIKKAEE